MLHVTLSLVCLWWTLYQRTADPRSHCIFESVSDFGKSYTHSTLFRYVTTTTDEFKSKHSLVLHVFPDGLKEVPQHMTEAVPIRE